ncbi:phosphoribosyl pyrophosphokinase [Neocallimastix californiae]|uniref:ribose-phosphate diphosphokinase n=1 Tax=Neocallimastix californiae TaxID=1754190 RepID=A0A1Y2BTH9_9FUNG|nr:phosphoribosyl pyrophosphokinase [Neocallimastix californiae]|eukprot:ORY38041.1 phosphoribosyl pyrophosphokinase [Neocallimastix californiae]
MQNIVVFSGSSHPHLTDLICKQLGLVPGKCNLSKFSNQETNVELFESVREKDIFIVQSGCGNVNDNLIELLIMISACKITSAKRIVCVIPSFPYSRLPNSPYTKNAQQPELIKPKKNVTITNLGEIPASNDHSGTYKHWTCRAGNLVAKMIVEAGADNIITMDLHDPQFQGFFDIPVDNLSSQTLMANYIKMNIPDYQQAVITSPDAGGAKRATALAESLKMAVALVHKDRGFHNDEMSLVGNVKDKVCILIDDIIDTSSTITKAAELLVNHGAKKIYALITHAILSGDAIQRINDSVIDELIVSNSVPQDDHVKQCEKIKVFDIAPLFAETIRRIHNGESVSSQYRVSDVYME